MATYYVAATGGSDANTGLSPAQSFATIAHGISVATSGDLLILSAGTFTPAAVLTLPDGISIQGQGQAQTTISFNFAQQTDLTIEGSTTLSEFTISVSHGTGPNHYQLPILVDGISTAVIVIKNVTVNAQSDGIQANLNAASQLWLTNVTFTSNSDAFIVGNGDGTSIAILQNVSITCVDDGTWTFMHGLTVADGTFVVASNVSVNCQGGATASNIIGMQNDAGTLVIVNSTITLSTTGSPSFFVSVLNTDGSSNTLAFGSTFDRSKVNGTLAADTVSGSGGLTPTQANVLANFAASFGSTSLSVGTGGVALIANQILSYGTIAVSPAPTTTAFSLTTTSGVPLQGQWLTVDGQQRQIATISGSGPYAVTVAALSGAPTAGDAWSVTSAGTQGQAAGILAAIAALPQTVAAVAAAVWAYAASSITTAGSIGVALLAGLAKLANAAGIAIVNPVVLNKNITIVQGDAYDATTAQVITFSDNGTWPIMTSMGVQLGTVEVKCVIEATGGNKELSGTVTGTSPAQVITLTATAAQTTAIPATTPASAGTPPVLWPHAVIATLDYNTNTEIRTLITGQATVNPQVTVVW